LAPTSTFFRVGGGELETARKCVTTVAVAAGASGRRSSGGTYVTPSVTNGDIALVVLRGKWKSVGCRSPIEQPGRRALDERRPP
jgi:hypothetical protein